MKVFLVYPNINSAQTTIYSCGLGYIAAVLKNAGHKVDYLVLTDLAEDKNRFLTKVMMEKPDVVGLAVNSAQFLYLKDLVREIKSRSSAYVVFGGVHPTVCPECIGEVPALDAVIRGEGEYPMLELVESLAAGKLRTDIKNIWFRRDGGLIKNDIRPLITDLDSLPMPDRNFENFQNRFVGSDGSIRFIFSRGCPFDCSYCGNRALSAVYPNSACYFRQRSPAKAIAEIVACQKAFSFKRIIFDDDNLSMNHPWLFDFFTLYQQQCRYPFECNLRVGTFDRAIVSFLKSAGLVQANIGLEHGDENFRKQVLKRDMANDQIIAAGKIFRDFGVKVKVFVMIGLPFETRALFLQTVKLCRSVSREAYYGIFHPYPKTALHDLCQKNGWLPAKVDFKERSEAVIDYPGFNRRQIQACFDAFPWLIRFDFLPLWLPFWFFRILGDLNRWQNVATVILFWPLKMVKKKIQKKRGDSTIKTRHIMFVFANHFEPDQEKDGQRAVDDWTYNYPAIAGHYLDADGVRPKHTWFYDGQNAETLRKMAELCRSGLGELEMHLHHGGDSAASLERVIRDRLAAFNQVGAMITAEKSPRVAYGFIHGKWSLDNSRGKRFCGVNNELTILAKTGCYGDFTFPAWGRMQPKQKNRIYYAFDDPARPKSYDNGVRVAVGQKTDGDLMIIEGPGSQSGFPLALRKLKPLSYFLDWFLTTPQVEFQNCLNIRRVKKWIKAGVTVAGRPEWIFVKVHTHGALKMNRPSRFGHKINKLFGLLAEKFNDGCQFQLHYVTAREAYNIIKAAESGMDGNPGNYRDYEIKSYCNSQKNGSV